jgi:hypothetical protein
MEQQISFDLQIFGVALADAERLEEAADCHRLNVLKIRNLDIAIVILERYKFLLAPPKYRILVEEIIDPRIQSLYQKRGAITSREVLA